MRLKESPLALTEIKSNLEYELEKETNTGSILSPYILSSSTPPPQLSLFTLINLPPYYYNMSHHTSISLEQMVW